MNDTLLYPLRDAKILHPDKCSKLDCDGVRCDRCFDLDVIGFRRRQCNGEPCERKQGPRWFENMKLSENLLMAGSRLTGLAYIEACHWFTGQEGASEEEEFPVASHREFPRNPW